MVKDVYERLPPDLKDNCPWNTFADIHGRIISPRRTEEIINVCREFDNPTWTQTETIHHFVSMLDVILDTKRDAVVDALIRLYPGLCLEVRSQVDLDVDIIARVQSGNMRDTKLYFHKIAGLKKIQLRGTSDIAAVTAFTFLTRFIRLLDQYPETDHVSIREAYTYRPLYGSR